MSTEANKAVIRRLYDEVWFAGNVDTLDELMAPGLPHRHSDPQSGDQKAFIVTMRAKYPDLRFEISHMVAEGDLVAWRWIFRGSEAETGTRVTQEGMSMNRFQDGKVVERWLFSLPSKAEEA